MTAYTRPTVEVLKPIGDITDTLSPTIEWIYRDSNSQEQYSYRIYIEEIYNQNDPTYDFQNYDSGEVVSVDRFFNVPVELKNNTSYYFIIAVKNQDRTSSLQVKTDFKIVVGDLDNIYTTKATLTVDPNTGTILSDSTEPLIEWDYYDPNNKRQTGFEIKLTDTVTQQVIYESGRIGSSQPNFQIPSGYISSSSATQVFKVDLIVYNEDYVIGDASQIKGIGVTSGYLYITVLNPEVVYFIINGGASQTFTKDVTLGFSVSYAYEMMISEVEDFAGASWVPYLAVYPYTIETYDVGDLVTLWAKFRTSSLNESSVVHATITLLDASTTKPVITRWLPTNTSTNVPIETPIEIWFSKTMNIPTVENSFGIYYLNDQKLPVTFQWTQQENGLHKLTVTSLQTFYNTEYTIKIDSYVEGALIKYPKDSYGNGFLVNPALESVFTTEVSFDRSAPINPSIVINGGDLFTSRQVVTLVLNADGSPTQMMIYGDVQGVTQGWIKLVSPYNVKVTDGDGTKNIYVQFRDASLNVSKEASDSIIYKDTIPPSKPILTPVVSPVYQPYTTFNGFCEPGVTVRLMYEVLPNSPYGEVKAGVDGSFSFVDVPLTYGQNNVYAIAVDTNENKSDKSNIVVVEYRIPDRQKPQLVRAAAINNSHVELYFSEMLNAEIAAVVSNYIIEGLLIPVAEVLSEPRTEGDNVYWIVRLTTSSQKSQSYVITVKNLKDTFGNDIDLNYNRSVFYGAGGADTTKPILISALAITNKLLEVEYSESMEQSSTLTVENYTISGLRVTNVKKGDNDRLYRLTTTQQSKKNYTVVIANVKDLSGNVINPSQNTAIFKGVAIAGSGDFKAIRAKAIGNDKVQIEFSEDLDFTTALVASNYSIIGLDILSAEAIESNIVELTTSPQKAVNFLIAMKNIRSKGA